MGVARPAGAVLFLRAERRGIHSCRERIKHAARPQRRADDARLGQPTQQVSRGAVQHLQTHRRRWLPGTVFCKVSVFQGAELFAPSMRGGLDHHHLHRRLPARRETFLAGNQRSVQ